MERLNGRHIFYGLAFLAVIIIISNQLREPHSESPFQISIHHHGTHSPLELKIHFLDGLPESSSRSPNQLRFIDNRPQITLLLSNKSDQNLELWRPMCPQGDQAFSIQFKTGDNFETEGIASPNHIYTGGMGKPKTMTLSPGNSLIHPLDFTNFWRLPFKLAPGETKTAMMRVVYQPPPSNGIASNSAQVWQGRIETPWRRTQLVNTTSSSLP